MTTLDTAIAADVRASLANNPEIGAGNFLYHALETNSKRDIPIIHLEQAFATFYGETIHEFSLVSLLETSKKYAAFYFDAGVRAKDVISVYLDDSVAYLVHYQALVSLGAIPALINGNMPLPVAAGHIQRIGSFGVFTDSSRQKELLERVGDALKFLVTEEDLAVRFTAQGEHPPLPLLYPYQHHADAPIMIAHSSGTTGTPKPVLLQHERFFYGIRYRLSQPSQGPSRFLSSLPHSHNCAIAYIMLALLVGDQIFILSDHSGPAILRAIEDWEPTMVVSFPQSFVEITESQPENYETQSVKLWMNGGDAAHETHIRQLLDLSEGARFIDGMGSSEMGFSLFRHVHTQNTDHYDRCVGKPHPWVSPIIYGPDDVEAPFGVVGRLAVKSPSVTTGYWNDSALTHRSQINGYWLTGDLAYRDAEGWFYHVDRTPDVILTRQGPLYSLQTEELLMKSFAAISDCSVYAVTQDGMPPEAKVVVRIKAGHRSPTLDNQAWLIRFNEVLKISGRPVLSGVQVVQQKHIPLGSTGKVLKRQLRDAELAVSFD